MIPYFNCHNHTMYSNIRLLDCINRPEDLINRAKELGMTGIAITDHECLCSHVEVLKIAENIEDFVVALGNEIYLTDDRSPGQKYYHFILIAKDEIGHEQLRELSSIAWYNSYTDRRLERVPTLKSELEEIVSRNPGHLIATSACLGGELSSNALLYNKSLSLGDKEGAKVFYDNICNFINYCQNLFGNDFYIECAPANNNDQIVVNKVLEGVANYYNIKMVVGTDSHYLDKKDRWVHKGYLNSKSGEREVDSFYEFARLMDGEEVKELLELCFSQNFIEQIFNNTIEIQSKIKKYSLFHKQDIPMVEVPEYPKIKWENEQSKEFPTLTKMYADDDPQNRYWVNQCYNKLKEIGKCNKEYLDRLEEEARVKSVISEKLETNMFRYPNTLQHYIDLIWNCGSMVGAGRGSSCAALNHYLMGITQLDPIQWELPFFRYLNDERIELGDIDIDICPSKRPLILQKIREERKAYFDKEVADWAKNALGCTLIATFGTEGTRSAIQTACRGYRSDEYPDGIDSDEGLYMASLIPEERGFLWPIKDVVYGNPEKGRRPVAQFINSVNRYPGLLEIIVSIEGLVNKRGSHASGIIFFDNNPFAHSAFMRTPSGDIITQFDLHNSEYMGLTKYDFLVTEVQDKLVQTIKLLQEDGEIEKDLSLKEIYNKYFHPDVLPLEDQKIWDALSNVSVINTFQFDSQVGAQAAKAIRPQTVLEMSDANGLMRLMGEDGEERPIDKYVRFKKDISLWYKEMTDFGLTPEEQGYLEPYFKPSYGVPPSQEQLMKMLMDKNICHFSLGEANIARKIVGKKQMNKIPELRKKVLDQASSQKLGQYVWRYGAGPQMGYSFSLIHALAYSFIGVQTLFIATNWNPIYWDCACLIVNSGSLQDNSEEELVDIYEPENDDLANGVIFEDLPDRSAKIRRTASTDYEKIAKAIGEMIAAGIKISLVDINKSDFSFKPDVKNNQILFGMKGLLNVGDEVVTDIINNRPYTSPRDFINKVNPKKTTMISLIKAGAFDNMIPDRKVCLGWYLWEVCDKKSRLTLQNIPTLMNYNLVPENTEDMKLARRIYEFNRYLKAITKANPRKINGYFIIDERAINFLYEINCDDLIEHQDNLWIVNTKLWDKIYQKTMDIFRNWITENKDILLNELNSLIFKEEWDKYTKKKNNISAWEMEVMCFYYHEHELKNLNNDKYGFSNFFDLPEKPEIERSFTKANKTINIFKLSKICGTCIAKNKTKSTVSLLTTAGVVNVKFNKEYFAAFDKRISKVGEDGHKHIIENSFFERGSMIVVKGIRNQDTFIAKNYASSSGHQLYKITEVKENGEVILQHDRASGQDA